MFKLVISYIGWHYSEAIRDLVSICRNFIFFWFHFFSISTLLRTLFSPWQMLGEPYRGTFNISDNLGIFALNTIMRIVGFFIRISVIVFGLVVMAISVVMTGALLIFWLLLPMLIIVLLVSGLRLLAI